MENPIDQILTMFAQLVVHRWQFRKRVLGDRDAADVGGNHMPASECVRRDPGAADYRN